MSRSSGAVERPAGSRLGVEIGFITGSVAAVLTVVALSVTAGDFALYAVANVVDPSTGFAIFEAIPPTLAALALPGWSAAYAWMVPRDRPGWQWWVLRFPVVHLVAWWTPVLNVVAPFLLVRRLVKADEEASPKALPYLTLWAAAWALCVTVFWLGYENVVDANAGPYNVTLDILAALASVAGARTVATSSL